MEENKKSPTPKSDSSGPKLQLVHVLLIALASLIIGAFTGKGKPEPIVVVEGINEPIKETVKERIRSIKDQVAGEETE